jgi:hypothetical protein
MEFAVRLAPPHASIGAMPVRVTLNCRTRPDASWRRQRRRDRDADVGSPATTALRSKGYVRAALSRDSCTPVSEERFASRDAIARPIVFSGSVCDLLGRDVDAA